MAYYMCSLPDCRSRKVKDFGVFKIPMHEPTRSRWLRFMLDNGKKDPQQDKVYRLCENHFDPSDVVVDHGRKCLKKGSVPIFGANETLESITEEQIEQLKKERKRLFVMTPKGPLKCQCCLKALKGSESRIPVNAKTMKIFETLVGLQLPNGAICGKCNINLLSFHAFYNEIKTKHEQERIMTSRSQMILAEELEQAFLTPKEPAFPVPKRTYSKPAASSLESVVKVKQEEQGAEDANTEFIIREIDPDLETGALFVTEMSPEEEELLMSGDPETNEVQTETVEEPADVQTETIEEPVDNDDDDVIVLPEEPQVPIDLDEISDEPQSKKSKPEEETTMYKCEHCTAVSSKKEIIVAHIKHSHTFPCTECERVFPSEDRLKNHEMRSHSTLGNKRKQSLQPTNLTLEDRLKFRLKAKPYGRPWHKARPQIQ